jgi:hypothetical protein
MLERIEKKHKWWYGVWEFYHWDKFGNLIWTETVENALQDEGEQLALDTFLRNASLTEFYLGLANDTPVETDTLADLVGEPSGNGYARQQIERSDVGWPTLELDAGDYMGTSKLVTFTANGGSIGPVNIMFLTNVASGTSGKYVSWASLSTSRTIQDQESLGCKMKIKMK